MGCEPAAATRADRAVRVLRLLWPDRNPLRRRCDRFEALILAALVVAFLVAAPLVVIATEHAVYGDAARRAQGERAAWHQVKAVLLDKPATFGYSAGPEALAWWTAPGGARRTGLVTTPINARIGSTVRIWTDASGQQTGPPLSPGQVRGAAVAFAIVAPLVLGIVLLGAGITVRVRLARRRLTAWDAEWRVAGPQWSRQR
jgi:hypothetical protein